MALNKYPRPHFKRKDSSWQNLNGDWDYTILEGHEMNDLEIIEKALSQPDGKVCVPYSIETKLSGVNKQLLPHQTLLMKTIFDTNLNLNDQIVLHIGAVDQQCRVWLNQKELGYHEDGYLSFDFDITEFVKEFENELIVAVIDESDQGDYPWGKQKLKRGQIWYTPQSGIWQTVWLETVPASHCSSFYYEYLGDGKIDLFVMSNHDYQIEVFEATLNGQTDEEFLEKEYESIMILHNHQKIHLPKVKEWSPDFPWLYPVVIRVGEDEVKSYMGLRRFTIQDNKNNVKKVYLNNQELFQSGVLDQGYFEKGLYTPDHEEMMLNDLLMLKDMGFNMVRKHIKVELLRWYFDCDRLGLIVHQDMVNSGNNYNPLIIQVLPFINIHLKDSAYKRFGQQSEKSRQLSIRHQHKVIDQLKFFCCIGVWVISNEGWGQFDSLKLAQLAREQDKTRLIDHASGWHDQKGGDFKSPHVYYKKIRLKPDHRALLLSEFGGYSYGVEEHIPEKPFGYRKYKEQHSYNQAVLDLYEHQIVPYRGILSGCIYTQLSDVEDEINGLVTFDRKVIKWDSEDLFKLNQKLIKGEVE